ncbi:unnamed protein product [Notodromas monacha]|uniref:Uncharacterized protein n=1 Tax=Notodromas monacha TaxID=399045 RepID=A0A7R9GGD7_9CRUS|nr:unnamed protein product [Notodromas monacha]CAG0920275.1 unnamed protein product [Notodromas monacha]
MPSIPPDAFATMPTLTLLALDGNPMRSLPERAFVHLNTTLRGLSLGGKAMDCDCHLRWVAEWIRDHDLQVTSRERNPQFCGSPARFRDRTFYQLSAEEYTAGVPKIITINTNRPPHRPLLKPNSNTINNNNNNAPLLGNSIVHGSSDSSDTARDVGDDASSGPLLTSYQAPREMVVKDAFRRDNSVIIQWEALVGNILGFRVVYRLFGEDSFKQGPPLASSERENASSSASCLSRRRTSVPRRCRMPSVARCGRMLGSRPTWTRSSSPPARPSASPSSSPSSCSSAAAGARTARVSRPPRRCRSRMPWPIIMPAAGSWLPARPWRVWAPWPPCTTNTRTITSSLSAAKHVLHQQQNKASARSLADGQSQRSFSEFSGKYVGSTSMSNLSRVGAYYSRDWKLVSSISARQKIERERERDQERGAAAAAAAAGVVEEKRKLVIVNADEN